MIRQLLAPLLTAAMIAAAAPAVAYTNYVTNEKGNSITVLDSETWQVTATIDVGQRPRGILVSADGRERHLCVSDGDVARVFETANLKQTHTLPSGPDPELMVFHPSGNPIYIANEDANLVTVVDGETGEVIKSLLVGQRVWQLAFTPDKKYLVTTNGNSNDPGRRATVGHRRLTQPSGPLPWPNSGGLDPRRGCADAGAQILKRVRSGPWRKPAWSHGPLIRW
jgi:YVTN family beta-propeller protein